MKRIWCPDDANEPSGQEIEHAPVQKKRTSRALKKMVRERMAITGESYCTALAALRAKKAKEQAE